MTKKKYSFKDHPEHKAKLTEWCDQWIANAISTKPMDDNDKAQMRIAIKGLYESAGLTPPPEHRIVFVPSPFVARFAGGFAAAIWWQRKNPNNKLTTDAATRDATDDATYAATRDATYAATDAATRDATHAATRDATYAATHAATRAATDDATSAATDDATYAATRDATRDATYAATDDATYAATRDATDDATRAATYAATYAATHAATRAATDDATDAATRAATHAATRAATHAATRDALSSKKPNNNWFNLDVSVMINLSTKLGVGKFGLACAADAWRMYQGGNFWSAWDSFLSFFRHVAKLDIDYSKYQYWEMAARHGGYRIMHPEFCIVSDRPEILKVDDRNRPHGEKGPFCKWRDGTALYAWHGTRIPAEWMDNPASLTPQIALTWPNIEQRRAACEIIGWARILKELNAKTIDKDPNPQIGELLEVDLPDIGKERFLRVLCGTGREFAIPVSLYEYNTARECNAATYGWTKGQPIENFIPTIRT